MPERLTNPCRACGVPLSYTGSVATTDLILDYLRAILSRLSELEAKLDAQTPRIDFLGDSNITVRLVQPSEDRPSGGREL